MMIHSSAILRFHHLYVLQTILVLQRQCNIWYSRLKHKFAFLLHERLHLGRLKSLKFRARRGRHCHAAAAAAAVEDYDQYQHHYEERLGGYASAQGDHQLRSHAANLCGQFLTDLNQMLLGGPSGTPAGSTPTSFSIPMQMLLLPIPLVQRPPTRDSPPCAKSSMESNLGKQQQQQQQQQHAQQQQSVCRAACQSAANARQIPACAPLEVVSHARQQQRHCHLSSSSGAQTPVRNFHTFMMSEQSRRNQTSAAAAAAAHQQRSRESLAAGGFAWTTCASGGGGARSNAGTRSIALRNPLICFPSTSNEIGHVKYM